MRTEVFLDATCAAVVPCLRKGEVAAAVSDSLARCLRSLTAMEM